jgi:carboxymethylenebutenolidase
MHRSQLAETITVPGHHGDPIESYLARPLEDGRFPSMVVLHHAPGWDEATMETVRKFAHHGYAAICPHLFGREGRGAANPEDAAAAGRIAGGAPDDRVVGDVGGALEYLRQQDFSNGKVGVIGFCSGGRQAYLAACQLPLDAAVDCWGGSVVMEQEALNERHPVAPIDMTANLGCPLLGIFGADDYNPSQAQVELIEKALQAHGKTYEFHSYEGAGHSFFTVDELNYRVEQTLDGWKRIFDFLGRYLA